MACAMAFVSEACWQADGASLKYKKYKSVAGKMLHVFGGLKSLLPGTSARRDKPRTEGIVASLHYKVKISSSSLFLCPQPLLPPFGPHPLCPPSDPHPLVLPLILIP
jgi:hypothetical protein